MAKTVMNKQTKIFIAISSFLIGIAFIGTGIFEEMVLQSIGKKIHIAIGIIFLGVGFIILAETRSHKK